MKLSRFSEKNIPLVVFVLVSILAYGLFIPFTGFYWDDWAFSWIANFLGPAEFFPAFIGIRPFLAPIFFVTTSLIPPVPIYWQIFALVIRLLAGFSAWFAFSHIWPHFKLQVLVASLLFLVFPAYSQHWVAYTHINQEWIAFIFYLLSIGLTANALRNPQKFKKYTIYAIILFIEGLFATEYFFGMEPLRFLFIWVIVSEESIGIREAAIRAFKVWIPYLIIWIINAIWLASFYSRGYNSYDLEVLNTPFSMTDILFAVVEVVWKAGLYAWAQVLVLTSNAITAPSTILTYVLIVVTFIVLFLIIRNISDSLFISKRTYTQFILIGLAGIVLGRIPSLAAGLPFRLQSSFDRFAISMMLGGSLFILGLVEWLIKNQHIRVYVFVLLIALGTGQQFFNGNIFRHDWERQQEIFWQLKWRIPSLKPNTLIITDEIAVDYESDISLVGPINWIYAPNYKRGNLPYLLLYIGSRLGGTLPSIEPNTDIQWALRTVTFHGNTSQAIVIHVPDKGCLRVLDPEQGDRETYSKKLQLVLDAIHLSDTSLILEQEIPAPFFLSKPAKTWCFYYTKAELARQFKEWGKILALQNEANTNGYKPADPFEWLPFIEANAMTANFNIAINLSADAIKNDKRVRIGVCKVWERVQTQALAGGNAKTRILDALSKFQCVQQHPSNMPP